MGGLQFPFACELMLRRRSIGGTVGLLYGIDLLGSCFGAFLTGLLLVPLLGIYGSCLTLSALNAAIFPWAYRSIRVIPPRALNEARGGQFGLDPSGGGVLTF